VFPDDSHQTGCKNTGRCKEPAKTWPKQPVNNFFLQFGLTGHKNTGSGEITTDLFPGRKAKCLTRNSGGLSRMVNVSKEGQVYECEICGNVVVVKEVGGGELVCCGEPMKLIGG
jgi:desulfoferrodoxin-like iron-binding protein